jgi:hypothetical protein
MKRRIGIGAVCALLALLAGCTTFTGVKPVHPKAGNPDSPDVVESLQPTFQWEPYPDAAAYDLIVWNRIKKGAFSEGADKAVYYREGLKDTTHRMETPLKPDSEYLWSVRVRRGTSVSNWSLYEYSVDVAVYGSSTKQPFVFKTPKAD